MRKVIMYIIADQFCICSKIHVYGHGYVIIVMFLSALSLLFSNEM